MRLLGFFVASVVLVSAAMAQNAVRVVSERRANGNGASSSNTAPEQAVVLDPKVSWIAAPDWDSNQPPKAFGYDPLASKPEFTVVDASAKTLWIYRPLVPIDLSKYPILRIKYRATNFDKDVQEVVRMVHGKAESAQVVHFFTGNDVVSDGREHELKTDLRETNATQPLSNLGIWVSANDQGNATFEINEISFSAADDTKPDKSKDDTPIKVFVTDDQDKPAAGVKVTLDAERLNFARTGVTDDKGEASITPITNESSAHSIRIQKDGYVMTERAATAQDREVFKLIPASYYGGVVKDDNGKPLAKAMVKLHADQSFTNTFKRELLNCILTDSSGRWTAPPYPADTSLFKVTLTNSDSGEETELDASTLKRSPPLKIMTVSPVARSSSSSGSSTPSVNSSHASNATPKVQLPGITATKVDDSTVTGDLVGFKDSILQLVTKKNGKDQTQALPLEDVVDFTIKTSGGSSSSSHNHSFSGAKPTTNAVSLKNCRLETTSGDKLMGEVTGWADRKLSFSFESSNTPISIPIEHLNFIWSGSQDMITKAKALGETASTEDIAFAMKDKDVVAVRGVAIGIEGDALKFRFNDQDRKLPIARLVGVALAHPDQNPAAPAFDQLVTLSNSDDILSGKITAIDANELELISKWDQPLRIPLSKVSKVTCRNGKLAYLSDMKPSSVEQTPFFDRLYSYKMDKSLDGKNIQIQDGSYPRGISVHSRCRLTFDLGARYDELRTKVGFQQPEGKLGECIVRVVGDGKTLFEKLDARGDDKAFDVKVPVTGVQKLTLEVDYGKNQDVGDRVVWANARVLRSGK